MINFATDHGRGGVPAENNPISNQYVTMMKRVFTFALVALMGLALCVTVACNKDDGSTTNTENNGGNNGSNNGGGNVNNVWVDLGLPSGTMWKNANEVNAADTVYDFYTYDEAVAAFGDDLPTKGQLEELQNNCQWTWNGSGYTVTGRNGHSIVLPAAGYRSYDGVIFVGSHGFYWSSTPSGSYPGNAWHLGFHDSIWVVVYQSTCSAGLSVRLVKNDDVWVDLGLPSGTKWKNADEVNPADSGYNFYTYAEAVAAFGDALPTGEQLEELKDNCQWTWNGSGYTVTGPNGNSIVLPAAGYRDCSGSVSNVGSYGRYWSSTPNGSDYALSLHFYSGAVSVYDDYRCNGLSVRLVKD